MTRYNLLYKIIVFQYNVHADLDLHDSDTDTSDDFEEVRCTIEYENTMLIAERFVHADRDIASVINAVIKDLRIAGKLDPEDDSLFVSKSRVHLMKEKYGKKIMEGHNK